MSQQPTTRRRWWSLPGTVALGLLFSVLPQAHGQEVLRHSFATPGNSKPIQLYADDISTWTDGPRQVFLLKGRVWIEQGVLNLRAPQAVVWVDQQGKKDTGIYQLQLFGENLTLEDGPNGKTAQAAVLQLATRGEIRIKSYASKVAQRASPKDPLYVRALRESSIPVATAATPAKAPQAFPLADKAAPLNAPPKNDPNIQLTQGVAPAPPVVVPVPVDKTPSAPPPQTSPPLQGIGPLAGPPGDGSPKQLTIRSRTSETFSGRNFPQANGETAHVINSGVILTITEPATRKVLLDIEADRLVFWTKGNAQELFGNLRSPQGETTKSLEFYLSGNVEIRNQSKKETEIIRADEVYYDVNRNVAIALRSDLEIRQATLPYPIHFKAEELYQLNAKLFQAKQTEVYSTILPSDPGLKIQVREAQIEERDAIKKSIFGRTILDRKTGQPQEFKEHLFTGRQNVVRLEGVPIFYLPYLKANVEDPLGPLENISLNYNRVFGFQVFTTWDMYELLGVQRPDGHRWTLLVDGLSERGPALGTEYDFSGVELFDIPNNYQGVFKLYGVYDQGQDLLGGDRGVQARVTPAGLFAPVDAPDFRGRAFANFNLQDLPYGFSVQAQVAAISDRNFLEQYFPREFEGGPDQNSYVYVKQQNNIWAWTVLAEAGFHRWWTHTDYLPRVDGHVLGASIFDIFTYNVHGSATYAQLRPAEEPPFAFSPTDREVDTGRFNVFQELSLPLSLGAFKVVPYVAADLAYYTEDLLGDDRGRLYGGAGVRASLPLSRLYPDVHSDIFNLNGIFHKIVLSGNYYAAHSTVSLQELPQIDRLNDQASDQAIRDIRPWQPIFNPANAQFLTNSRLFDPQSYALRRLVDNRIDTLDSIDVLQLGMRQRWQTKRGYPGREHVIDWMTLDLQASLFPHSNRDNFGEHLGILEYDWVWNIGDRTALVSNGWFEPIDNGPRVFNFGTHISRPDRTSFYLGYRHIDPLESRAVIASLTYAFSAKYAITFATNYDFGTEVQSNALMITRMGTDLTISLGLSYDSTVNSFGVQFEVLPNLIPNQRIPTARGVGNNGTALANR